MRSFDSHCFWYVLLLLITINIDVFSYLAFYEILSYLLTFCIKDIWLTFNQISCMQFSRYILTDALSVIRNIKYSVFWTSYLRSLITGKTSYINSSSRLIRVSTGLYDSYLAPSCFRQDSLSNACFIFIRLPACCFLFDLAPTCSPTPSPVQYHRPIGS